VRPWPTILSLTPVPGPRRNSWNSTRLVFFDDSIREDGEADPDGDEAADGDRGNDEDSSDDKDQETEDEKDDD
jgi:hypothetical protein